MAWTSTRRLADAILNDVVSGLRGYHQNLSLSIEQLEQEIVEMRLLIMKEYMMKGVLPVQDLLLSLNCVPVDCDKLSKCRCGGGDCGKPIAHFQIPQVLFDFGTNKAIQYIGSIDKQNPFLVYTKPFNKINSYQKYGKRGKNKPWVYVDVTPNHDGLIDCYIFNAPLIKFVSVVAIFKDLRQLEEFQCNCEGETQDTITQMDNNLSFLDTLIKDRLTQQKLRYYRGYQAPLKPNDQEYTTGG